MYKHIIFNIHFLLKGTGSGCSSNIGYSGGRQTINLAPYEPEVGCFRQATIIHEMFHTLGLYHMQSATERDDYVTIIPENVQSGTINNFNKANENLISQFGVPYDVGSIMHYGAYAFSSNGYATIVPHVRLYFNIICIYCLIFVVSYLILCHLINHIFLLLMFLYILKLYNII